MTGALATTLLAACSGGQLPPDDPPPATPPPAAPSAKPPAKAKPEFESPGGMWLPRQLTEHGETLKKLGLELDPAELADPTSHPLGAVVSLGGCSASFVSSRGLIATNHHCVTGALQYNSTPKENLLESGFYASKLGDERWNGPSARVYVTRSFRDVTDTVRKGLDQIEGDLARYEEIEKRTKQLVADCEKKTANVRCDVQGFFGGGEYLLIERLEIKDVRLVYAPARSVGSFGGEIDNWMWPRHSGDFAFYRAYVGKDGTPAEYSKDNVPYEPPHHLKLPSKPLRQGDLVFVAGYPGRTSRLYTAAEVREAVDWYYPRRIALFEEYLKLIRELSQDDEELKLKATPLEHGLANALKYTKGATEGLVKGGAAKRRDDAEAQLRQWIAADESRKQSYGEVFARMDALSEKRVKTREADAALRELLFLSKMLGVALEIVRMAEERPKPDAERDPEYQKRNWEQLLAGLKGLDRRYNQKLDRALMKKAIERALRLPKDERPAFVEIIVGKGDVDEKAIDRAVDALYSGTKLEDEATRVKLFETGKLQLLKYNRDPFIQLALKLRPLVEKWEDREKEYSGAMSLVRPLYVEAVRKHADAPVAPDANSTLRVTFGTVRGYRPKPGADRYVPFTKLEQILKKDTGQKPFDSPKPLLKAIRAGEYGPYRDEELGTVPVNFLSDTDITGGNSGSATLNEKGEIVGLAFDGNYEAMASDWVFMPEITRAIHVDMRYVLWMLDAVAGADRLLEEMGAEPALP